MIVSLKNCKPSKLNAKPHTVLYIGKSKNTAYNFMSLLLDLSWLSIKALDFINWSIIYILVCEGKHITPKGKEIVSKLKVRSYPNQCNTSEYGVTLLRESTEEESKKFSHRTNFLMGGQLISKEVLELLNNPSNYVESDQPGIYKVVSNYRGIPSIIHKLNSPQKMVSFRSFSTCLPVKINP